MTNEVKELCCYVSEAPDLGIHLNEINIQQIFEGRSGYVTDEMDNVTGLSLFEEGLSDISFLKNFKNLKWLNLSRNGISDISGLKNLINLIKLDLSNNIVKDISWIGQLKHLNGVNLANNQISYLPADILKWGLEIKWKSESLEGIILEYNPLDKSLIEAVKKGEKSIDAYIKSIKHMDMKVNPILSPKKNKAPVINKKWKVFLSYASEDKDKYVIPITEELKRRNITYWIDQSEIRGGESFAKEINDALVNSDYIVVFLSRRYFEKKWTQKEFWASMELERPDKDNVLIPIFIEPKDTLPDIPLLNHIHSIKWDEEGVVKVANEINRRISSDQQKTIPGTSSKNIEITSNLAEWYLEKIFQDQYDEGNARGIWSKMYPSYLNVFFEKDTNERKETITFSTWIADALLTYRAHCKNDWIKNEIKERINRFHDYLIRHYEIEINGFGMSSPVNSIGQRKIIFDFRHTAWAIIALTKIGKEDNETLKIIENACMKLWEEILNINLMEQFPITIATLHRFLSEKNISKRISASPGKIRDEMKRLEADLICKFNSLHHCWGWFNNNRVTKVCFDNSLMIMRILNYYEIIDVSLRAQMETTANHLLEKVVIHLDADRAALPFMKESKIPDLGATVLFLYILLKKLNFDSNNPTLKKLRNFIDNSESRMKYSMSSFSWYFSAILYFI